MSYGVEALWKGKVSLFQSDVVWQVDRLVDPNISEMEHNGQSILRVLSQSSHSDDLGLYIHIPFCQKRCHFCAFYLMTHREVRVQEFLSACEREIALYARQGGCDRFSISTMYFGGGTPTTLTPQQLAGMVSVIRRHFTVHPSVEITIEADPSTVNRNYLQRLYDVGVNRLSVGVQSLEAAEWDRLGRTGDMSRVDRIMTDARKIGFSNVSLDVMYGLPGQTFASWQRTLGHVIELQPNHVSCYALTIEPGTRFQREHERGDLPVCDVELEMMMYEQAILELNKSGLEQYEVSNFAQSGFECQHNLRYWSGLEYLGLGPSAQSYIDNMRFGNIADLTIYASSLAEQQLPVETLDVLTRTEALRERVIFGLRMNRGVPTRVLHSLENDHHWQSIVDEMVVSGLLQLDAYYLKTTTRGRQLMDTVASELL